MFEHVIVFFLKTVSNHRWTSLCRRVECSYIKRYTVIIKEAHNNNNNNYHENYPKNGQFTLVKIGHKNETTYITQRL